MLLDDRHLEETFSHFRTMGRGDSARGRNLQALLLLELCWSTDGLPMSHYRPRRSPQALLAMIFDVLGQPSALKTSRPASPVRDSLACSLGSFLSQLKSEVPGIAAELDGLLHSVLLDPKRSTLPTFLARLPLYMDAEQLALVDEARVIDALTMSEVFGYLGYRPPRPGPRSERHPIGRDLRKAFRTELDAVWVRNLERQEPNLTTLAACFPLDFVRLAERMLVPLPDFCFFYSLATDGAFPGRRWRPPAFYLGGEEARDAFEDLCDDPDFSLSRLNLSSTLPRTTACLDSWLGNEHLFPELQASGNWRAAVRERLDEIELARLHFLTSIGEELS